MQASRNRSKKIVTNWILIGLIMSLIQILLGGITRLTDSGLSITDWKLILGALPPIGEAAWNDAFERYQEIGQFTKVNLGMTLAEFKQIYFWEWFHRTWARLIGLVFMIPFFYFLAKSWMSKRLVRQLIFAMLLGAAQAAIGWIMVLSGLNTESIYVSPYKLSLHFFFALALVIFLWWIYLEQLDRRLVWNDLSGQNKIIVVLTGIFLVQLLLGCFVAGMRGARLYNTWPAMGGGFFPSALLSKEAWSGDIWLGYETNTTLPIFFQFLHRLMAYIFTAILLWFWISRGKMNSTNGQRSWLNGLLGLTLLQVILGIAVLLITRKQAGSIPVVVAVTHQLIAIFIGMMLCFHFYQRSLSRR